MKTINRRAFLKSSSGLLALAALDLADGRSASAQQEPAAVPGGANNRLNIAVIGVGGRGSGAHLTQYTAEKNCRITHLCDADTDHMAKNMDKARQSNGAGAPDPQMVQDMRRIFDDKSVDAVSIATCNHWHSLAAAWAMQAGKDVYVEKPLSHNFMEGKRVVDISARTGRVVQCGTQMRSNPAIIDAIAYLRSGAMGKILVSRGLCYKPRPSIGKVSGPQQPPSTVDYNLWCGPAPMAPLMREKLHYDWHWVWNYGNGDIGNQGIHEIDLARWAAGIDTYPKSVISVGGRFGYVDDGETPNTQVAAFDYGSDKPKVIIEVRGLNTPAYKSRGVENVVECEKGYLVSPGYTSFIAYDKDGNELKRWQGGGDQLHFNNFLAVVRSRKTSDLHMPAAQGHLSDSILHLGNISLLMGKQMPFSEFKNKPTDSDPDANSAIQRMIEHLAANNIPMDSTSFSVGPRLTFDGSQFTNNSKANGMLKGEYRAPFTLPSA